MRAHRRRVDLLGHIKIEVGTRSTFANLRRPLLHGRAFRPPTLHVHDDARAEAERLKRDPRDHERRSGGT
eukprot:CAMPEP_0176141306 /NCGR_PEP_ID=MMETSP0120_2-20121206/71850_1 /TAXON_ID=160619 /ORGANISM="Kryptoperidinium foliaceum, Strain CCMP 1326" /LENGTH=69 /DNA_ID=CAMNT_0017477433 /DNA_START=110 /DNA_END=316 /DNA_ORIENTATION=-